MPVTPPYRRRRHNNAAYGGVPSALPQVATLGATAITDTSAVLNGSVNPEGLATNWWFAWDTDGPPYANTTTPTAVGSTVAIPEVVGVSLAGLTTGQTYHFAVVASSTGGTVFGADTTFVAETPQPPLPSPPSPETIPPATYPQIPHFQMPFTITQFGAAVCQQDSQQEVGSCIVTIAECPLGAVPEIPSFGIPDITFSGTPPRTDVVVEAMQRLEPRARVNATAQPIQTGTTPVLGPFSYPPTMDPETGQWQVNLVANVGNVDAQNTGNFG